MDGTLKPPEASELPASAANGGATTVLVAGGQDIFLEGLALLVGTLPRCVVVGTARDGAEVVELSQGLTPQVIVMDARLPTMGGADATTRVLAVRPEVAVVMVSTLADDDSLLAALRAGARGYVLKEAPKTELLRALEAAAHGDAYFGHMVAERVREVVCALTASVLPPFPLLTPREREVLTLVGKEMRNLEIARHLHVSPKTVRNHVSNILGKLEVRSRGEAAVKARQAGLCPRT